VFLVRPSEETFDKFIDWKENNRQWQSFFGDDVANDACSRVTVRAGETLFIPSAWIFATYSSKDTVIFSGSFLHSFASQNQRKVAVTEDLLEASYI
jgi:hypothetical protein